MPGNYSFLNNPISTRLCQSKEIWKSTNIWGKGGASATPQFLLEKKLLINLGIISPRILGVNMFKMFV